MDGAQAIWIALGGNVAFLAIVAFLGRSIVRQWLDKDLGRFKQRLESINALELEQARARNAQELELARHRLETLLRQNSKIHEKEFQVLADIWEKLNEALGHVSRLVSSFQQYPDLDRMNDERFAAFVENSNLEKVDKDELLNATPRNDFYQERIMWYRIRDARKASTALHREIQRNSIFLDPEIRERFRKIDGHMWDAIVSREIGHEAGDTKIWREAGEKLSKDVEPLKTEIENLVQRRLGYGVGPQ